MASKKIETDLSKILSLRCISRCVNFVALKGVGLTYTKRKFSGFCHLHIGQEALAVGVQSALRPSYMLSKLPFAYTSHR